MSLATQLAKKYREERNQLREENRKLRFLCHKALLALSLLVPLNKIEKIIKEYDIDIDLKKFIKKEG